MADVAGALDRETEPHGIIPIAGFSLWRVITGAVLASSDHTFAGFFDKHRAQAQFVIDQSESVFLRKLRDLRLAIFFVFWPDTLQFVFVDGAIAKLVGFEPQSTSD